MFDWLTDNSAALGLFVDLTLMLVWVTYLNLFLIGFYRQNRSAIHISRAAAENRRARCLLTNMGQQNIFLLAIVVDLKDENGTRRAIATDREEHREDEYGDLLERTFQGPLEPGQSRDIGSFEELLNRAILRLETSCEIEQFDCVTVTAIAASNQAKSFVAAHKSFTISVPDSSQESRFQPESLLTTQIGGPFGDRRIRRLLTADWSSQTVHKEAA